MKIDRKKLEIAMARKNLSKKELCAQAGINPGVVSRKDERRAQPRTVYKIATALGVDVTEIIDTEGEG